MAIRIGSAALDNLKYGTSQVAFVYKGTILVWAHEIVVVVAANTNNLTLKSLFTTPVDYWSQEVPKRVVINSGVSVNATVNSHAILTSTQADGLSGSFGGTLVLEVRGIVSGIGGVANSGVGGSVINANFPGKNGTTKMQVNVIGGTLRAGGGGGGKGGNGGGGVYYTGRTVTEGPYINHSSYPGYAWVHNVRMSGAYVNSSSIMWGTMQQGVGAGAVTSYSTGGYTYYRGSLYTWSSGDDDESYIYYISRTYVVNDVPNNTNGGVAGNGGRGQGCDGVNTSGSGAVAGGTNAGAAGACGAGGLYGNSGVAGSNGTNGNRTSGTAGAAAGLAGYYAYPAANYNIANTGGTLLGRVA